MNKKRMLKWAAFLRTVPEEKFDMRWWGMSDSPVIRLVCASRACALGWATAIPEFARSGLELRAHRGDRYANVFFRKAWNLYAAMKFFGLTEAQAYSLVVDGPQIPKRMADKIEAMVRG